MEPVAYTSEYTSEYSGRYTAGRNPVSEGHAIAAIAEENDRLSSGESVLILAALCTLAASILISLP